VDARLLLARWVQGDLPPEDVPGLAILALLADCDSPTLRRLAGERPDVTRPDVDPLVRRTATELGLPYPLPEEASAVLVNHWLDLIAGGAADPYAGAKRIWRICREWFHWRPLWEPVGIFIALAGEWEDHPPYREACEAAILDEAQALVREGGFRPLRD
jgi:hypothetical protein